MNLHHSLRFRIIFGFTLAGIVLGVIFGGVVYGYLHGIEDRLIENILTEETTHFLASLEEGGDVRPPRTALLQGYLGIEQIPDDLRQLVAGRGLGIHEIFPDWHVALTEVPGREEHFYLFHRDQPAEPLENSRLIEIILIANALVIFSSGWFGYFIARRLIAPVVDLAGQVAVIEPSGEPVTVGGNFYPDEVGSLAAAFQGAMNRVTEFVERERRFTRDASHELRTPVTVIKGAAELIARNAGAGRPVEAQLRRLNRAVKDMENIIETFLYLGRQGSLPSREETCRIQPVVEDLVEANRYLVEDKAVELVTIIEEDFPVAAPEPVVRIAVGNLVRNACQYTDRGKVEILAAPEYVVVRDTGRGMSPKQMGKLMVREARGRDSNGFGLGLSIVNDFCQRYGWRLHFERGETGGTIVRLVFLS